MRACVGVCVYERERERERVSKFVHIMETFLDDQKICVCVCERERESVCVCDFVHITDTFLEYKTSLTIYIYKYICVCI